MDSVILSILTPAVPSRMAKIEALCAEIARQIGNLQVEHLIFLDNKKRTVGEKRDSLLRAARGQYVAFVDDDDWVSANYVRCIADAALQSPDVITFLQGSNVNGELATVEFRLGNPNEPFKAGKTIRRNAWHVCAWRRELAILSGFPPINYGEDWAFAAPLCQLTGLVEKHISEVLHYYRHDSRSTEAPPPGLTSNG